MTSLAIMFVILEELKQNVALLVRKTVLLVSCASSIVTCRNSFVLYLNFMARPSSR